MADEIIQFIGAPYVFLHTSEGVFSLVKGFGIGETTMGKDKKLPAWLVDYYWGVDARGEEVDVIEEDFIPLDRKNCNEEEWFFCQPTSPSIVEVCRFARAYAERNMANFVVLDRYEDGDYFCRENLAEGVLPILSCKPRLFRVGDGVDLLSVLEREE